MIMNCSWKINLTDQIKLLNSKNEKNRKFIGWSLINWEQFFQKYSEEKDKEKAIEKRHE